jgi:hypothetical protein
MVSKGKLQICFSKMTLSMHIGGTVTTHKRSSLLCLNSSSSSRKKSRRFHFNKFMSVSPFGILLIRTNYTDIYGDIRR